MEVNKVRRLVRVEGDGVCFFYCMVYSHYSAAVGTCNNYPSLAPKPP